MVSIPIAEGIRRHGKTDKARFLNIAFLIREEVSRLTLGLIGFFLPSPPNHTPPRVILTIHEAISAPIVSFSVCLCAG